LLLLQVKQQVLKLCELQEAAPSAVQQVAFVAGFAHLLTRQAVTTYCWQEAANST
jgi:hypothetical protein